MDICTNDSTLLGKPVNIDKSSKREVERERERDSESERERERERGREGAGEGERERGSGRGRGREKERGRGGEGSGEGRVARASCAPAAKEPALMHSLFESGGISRMQRLGQRRSFSFSPSAEASALASGSTSSLTIKMASKPKPKRSEASVSGGEADILTYLHSPMPSNNTGGRTTQDHLWLAARDLLCSRQMSRMARSHTHRIEKCGVSLATGIHIA